MKKRFLVLIIITIIVAIAALFQFDRQENDLSECDVAEKKMTVRGDSMSPFLFFGKEITAFFGYYNCNDISRNDVVLYDYSGNENLLIKFVKAVPGDRWDLKESSGSCEIIVNGEALLNSEGNPYSTVDCKILKLYASDYPVIPENTYLILGDKVDGSTDSTHFGLVSGKDIKAKVLLNQ